MAPESATKNPDRCYFGCVGIRLNHTLLDLPDRPSPRLCEDHSSSWRMYRACLIANTNTVEWPADFWPWAKRIEKEMAEETKTQETRTSGTEIIASEAAIGYWYTVPSGEIERCIAIKNRGRGVQVGFVGILETGSDPDDVRWLQGRTLIVVANEAEVAALMEALIYDQPPSKPIPHFEISQCPRNGLLCPECTLPQRQTPHGATCEAGHGGLEGKPREEIANQLAENGYTEEARVALLESGPQIHSSLDDAKAKLKETEERSNARLARAKEIEKELDLAENKEISVTGSPLVKQWAQALAGPSSVFHKSLHVDWRTPKPIFDAWMARWGPAWLDAAATDKNKLCPYWLGPGSEVEDALTVDWEPTEEIVQEYGKNIWLNHPYSKGEKACPIGCTRSRCTERGYHLDRPIASSGEWMLYARGQALGSALQYGGALGCLTKRSGETQWWKEAVRRQPSDAGVFVAGRSDPEGGPAKEFMDQTPYRAAMWTEFRWTRFVVDIVEIEGRVDFDRGGDDGSAGFPSVLVTYYRPK